MNDKVQAFLDAKKGAEMQKKEAKKQQALLDLGLYEKVYSPLPAYSEEYPFYEWDEAGQTGRYYKKAVVPVTDEEYAEILRYTTDAPENGRHPIAMTLKAIAIVVFIVGFIAGICYAFSFDVVGSYYSNRADMDFNFGVAFSYWGTTFIVGMLFLALSSIIQLLQDIKNK